MRTETLTKAPADVLDYDVRFEDWLKVDDRISDWSVKITGSSASLKNGDYANRSVRLWIEGGEAGETAHVELEVATAAGRVKSICFKIRIRECN